MEAELIASLGDDLTVVNAARVSFDKESDWKKNVKSPPADKELYDKDIKLIKYLKPKRAILTNLHADIDYNYIKKYLPKNVIPGYDGMSFLI